MAGGQGAGKGHWPRGGAAKRGGRGGTGCLLSWGGGHKPPRSPATAAVDGTEADGDAGGGKRDLTARRRRPPWGWGRYREPLAATARGGWAAAGGGRRQRRGSHCRPRLPAAASGGPVLVGGKRASRPVQESGGGGGGGEQTEEGGRTRRPAGRQPPALPCQRLRPRHLPRIGQMTPSPPARRCGGGGRRGGGAAGRGGRGRPAEGHSRGRRTGWGRAATSVAFCRQWRLWQGQGAGGGGGVAAAAVRQPPATVSWMRGGWCGLDHWHRVHGPGEGRPNGHP